MRKLLLILLVLMTASAYAQLEIVPLTRSNPFRQAATNEPLPAVSLPFWDDFSYATDEPDSLWEFSTSIYVNEFLGIDAPSYKVATFDGVDASGKFYDGIETYPRLADQLVSRRMNLSSYINDGSLYLSFFWQMGGNGEKPEHQGDSLRLQMLNADSVWVTQWKKQATQVTVTDNFAQVLVQVKPEFIHANFRFKFENFGSVQGPFDTWHIDYVYLNNGRSSADISINDQALTGVLTSLIAPYQEMPASHFFEDPSKYIVLQSFQTINLLDNDLDGSTMSYQLTITDKQGAILETVNFIDGTHDIDGFQIVNDEILDAFTPTPDIDELVVIAPISPAPDSVVIDIKLGGQFQDEYQVNDTIRNRHVFYQHYAYDDGSAEFAAGVRQNGSVAMRYVLQTKDTLTHIDIQFPSIIPSSVGKNITVQVWKKLNSNQLLASKSYTIGEFERNQFARIKLNSSIVVSDTIYIGYTQKTTDFLAVGLDRSNIEANQHIFYKVGGDWLQNLNLRGVLMIRPVFQDASNLVLSSADLPHYTWYPNPTTGKLTIRSSYSKMIIWSLDGKKIMEESSKVGHDVSFLEPGLYLLEIQSAHQPTQKFRLLKQ